MFTEKQKIAALITVFAGCVLLIMIGFFYFMLGRGQINAYETKARTLSEKLKNEKTELAKIEQQVAMGPELERQAEMVRKFTSRLPSSPDAPGFLNALVTILGTTGIVQQEVKPLNVTSRPVYTEIPYTVRAFGHYHAIGQFLTLIEQNKDRFMRVKHLKISNNKDRPSMHPVDMEITTFMFNK